MTRQAKCALWKSSIIYANEINAEICRRKAMVFKEVGPKDELFQSDDMKKAIAAEMKALTEDKKVFSMDKVRGWDEIVAKNGNDELVGFKLVTGIKHSEEPRSK